MKRKGPGKDILRQRELMLRTTEVDRVERGKAAIVRGRQ
jgi:hypothetical protein